eukprot:TRINITY_DN19453_c0_g1_i1.p1 TRINITY_DN19453_c0_g1~~TRINITY_DN19453_c0_g1_i1.p1  ORF type:complete len:741 (-),score=124.87 TRINITY_DN19453_c0_g1_i1:115-2337(-)
MGASQPPAASDTASESSTELESDEDNTASDRSGVRGRAAMAQRSGSAEARSSESFASSSFISSTRSSYCYLESSTRLCPPSCCGGGVKVGTKEYVAGSSRRPSALAKCRGASRKVHDEAEEHEEKREDKSEHDGDKIKAWTRPRPKGSTGKEREETKDNENGGDMRPRRRHSHRRRVEADEAGGSEAYVRETREERCREKQKPDELSRHKRVDPCAARDVAGAVRRRCVASPTVAALASLADVGAAKDMSPTVDNEDDDGARSMRSGFSVSTAIVARHGAGCGGPSGGDSAAARPQDAMAIKAALKDFVHSMVKGRELHVPSASGPRPVTCMLTQQVDALLIVDSGSRRRVLLREVMHVHHGLEAMPFGLDFKLGPEIVVLELGDGDFVALHVGHSRAADDLVMYLRLLSTIQRLQKRSQGDGTATTDNEDAQSECSIQTGIFQKHLTSTPVSSTSKDPREAKRMFKMFTETMRRGRDFYVVKPDGTLQDVDCSLSKGHDEFRMRCDGQVRSIPLQDVTNVLTHQEASKLGLGFVVDERCSTVELKEGECITFNFGHAEACERFILCMRILAEKMRSRILTRGIDGPVSCPTRGCGSTVSDATKPSSVDAEANAVTCVRTEDPKVTVELFVRQMVIGCQLGVVGPGGLAQVRCSMDTDLRELKLTAENGSCRGVPLARVRGLHVGIEAAKLDLVGVALDVLCATVELKSGDCITFRFPSIELRDRFVLSMRIFVTAHQQC